VRRPTCNLISSPSHRMEMRTRSSGEVRLIQDTTHAIGRPPRRDRRGHHRQLGHTLHYLRAMLGNRRPASLRAAVLLDKPYRRAIDVTVDYVGLTLSGRIRRRVRARLSGTLPDSPVPGKTAGPRFSPREPGHHFVSGRVQPRDVLPRNRSLGKNGKRVSQRMGKHLKSILVLLRHRRCWRCSSWSGWSGPTPQHGAVDIRSSIPTYRRTRSRKVVLTG